ncbi:cellulose-binding GDSL lipase/acylhydrolase [Aspergillus arachidicola]|uniref:Cellulose-binding GDSL lipase/acylhydrolase n=1 Tax=Aspergillus arachidicola TaxID=656916 RepID=A0A2G7ELV7_9EURO|nr:cellulose-binding GDSL lipase/acylhydrolase [Aspergillus arachidicola]
MKLLNSWLMASAISTVAARPWPRAANTTSTYFFTFGNSYTQTGFSTAGEQPSPSNPMGNPALGTGTTTGGENWVGYLTTAQNASLVLSYNLAVGGASIDNSLVQGSTDVDLASQVDIFDETYSSKPASAPWSAENSVFGFWIGINDIGNAFYNTDADTFTPKLIARLASLVERIYSAGGNATVEQHVAYLAVYNRNLESMVDGFKTNHTDVTVAYYDSWSFMTKVLDDPTDYGFPDATCINDDGTSCIWWNDYHPSAKYHQLQAEDMKKVLQPLGAW